MKTPSTKKTKRAATEKLSSHATRILQQFAGGGALTQKTLDAPRPIRIGLRVGNLLSVTYEVQRGDKRMHKFNAASAPTLIVSQDGKQLAIVGGHYVFTSRGIVDKR